MSKEDEKRAFIFYKRLMRQSYKQGTDYPVDFACSGCRNHRPDWKYRFCVLTECPYLKGFKTFREKFYEDGGETDAGISC